MAHAYPDIFRLHAAPPLPCPGKVRKRALFAEYQPTVNPFMFLRDLFGAMVIVGVGIAIYRRFFLKLSHLRTNSQDQYAIAILAVIMLSGILLHGAKIGSYTRYEEMVQEYAMNADEEDLKGLEAYWSSTTGPSPQGQGAL